MLFCTDGFEGSCHVVLLWPVSPCNGCCRLPLLDLLHYLSCPAVDGSLLGSVYVYFPDQRVSWILVSVLLSLSVSRFHLIADFFFFFHIAIPRFLCFSFTSSPLHFGFLAHAILDAMREFHSIKVFSSLVCIWFSQAQYHDDQTMNTLRYDAATRSDTYEA